MMVNTNNFRTYCGEKTNSDRVNLQTTSQVEN